MVILHTPIADDNSYVFDYRGMNSHGERVFFDTPDPLVAQDVNGRRDVYEWENGRVFLLSSGSSGEDSYFLDSSESGNDVFFETASELVEGDNDGAYDVYDARVPRPGDTPPPSAVPCQGEVCQGPPSVPELLTAPSSETFFGQGNIALQPQAVTAPGAKPVQHGKSKKQSRKRRRKTKSASKSKGANKSRKASRAADRVGRGRGKR
jgi:hypothetical protein